MYAVATKDEAHECRQHAQRSCKKAPEHNRPLAFGLHPYPHRDQNDEPADDSDRNAENDLRECRQISISETMTLSGDSGSVKEFEAEIASGNSGAHWNNRSQRF